jgi:CheY-like chemotaxis protein
MHHVPLRDRKIFPRMSGGDGDAAEPQRPRALVVDDDRDGANGLVLLLEIIGYRAAAVYDGAAVQDAIATLRPHVILLDISLPKVNGYELARTVRAQYPAIALVAVTGWAREEDRAQALAAGCDLHLAKPVNLETLRRALATLPRRRPV